MMKFGIVIWGLAVLLAGAAHAKEASDGYLQQSPGYGNPANIDAWRKGENRGDLKPYPAAPPGVPNPPGGVFQFGGSATSSFSGPDLGMPFAEWRAKMEKQRPAVDRAAHNVLESRFRFDCVIDKQATMSRGKPLPIGPTGRLPKGVDSWEQYAALAPEAIRKGDAFPWKPLDHPLHSTAHIVFPQQWTRALLSL
jgi:hypothetical protein